MNPSVLYLVRHAKAGSRERFEGPDALRPLSPRGMEQARVLVDLICQSSRPVRHVLSSPARRCRQTLEPLASRCGVSIDEADWLAEGADPKPALALLGELTCDADPLDGSGGPVAACTHGDIIWGVLELLAREGVDLGERPDAPKGGIWMIRLAPGADRFGAVEEARLVALDGVR